MRPRDLEGVLKEALINKLPLLIKGPPGVGKTDIITKVSRDLGIKCQIEIPVISDPTDYKGLPLMDPGESVVKFVPGSTLMELIETDKELVCFFDDIGQAPRSVQAALMQLILLRRIGAYAVSPHVSFVAATNRVTDMAGVIPLIEPLKSRFVSIVELTVNVDDWTEWAMTHDVDHRLIGFIRWRPELLLQGKPSTEMTNSPSPRTIAWCDKILKVYERTATPSVLAELVTGAVGEGFCNEFFAYLNVYSKLPPVESVIADPKKVAELKDPSMLYAFEGVLYYLIKSDKIAVDDVAKIGVELPSEYSLRLYRDLKTIRKDISKTKAVIKWTAKLGEVL